MTNKSLLKYGIAGLAILGFAGLAGYGANAANPGNPAELTVDADVTILSLITIKQVNGLDFGTITAPTAGTTDFVVDLLGNMTLGGGGDGVSLGGTISAAEFNITGEVGIGYTFTVTPGPGACSAAGLTLGSMTDNNTSTLDDNSVEVGGTLSVTSAAGAGTPFCEYTVKAEY